MPYTYVHTFCFLETVPSPSFVLLYRYIVFIKRVYTEGTVFVKPAVLHIFITLLDMFTKSYLLFSLLLLFIINILLHPPPLLFGQKRYTHLTLNFDYIEECIKE